MVAYTVGDGKARHSTAKHRTGCNSAYCGWKRPPSCRILSRYLHPETLRESKELDICKKR